MSKLLKEEEEVIYLFYVLYSTVKPNYFFFMLDLRGFIDRAGLKSFTLFLDLNLTFFVLCSSPASLKLLTICEVFKILLLIS